MIKGLSLATAFFSHSLFAYNVVFEGFHDNNLLKTLKAHSELISLKEHPPASLQSLEYRAQSDIPGLIKTLHSLGYYDAIIKARVEEVYKDTPLVILNVDLGPQYRIGSFDIILEDSLGNDSSCKPLNQDQAELHVGDLAITQSIINAQDNLLKALADCGYPLAEITERAITVNGKSKTVSINLAIKKGPLCYFGPLTIAGNQHVKSIVIDNKISWKEKDIFSRSKLNEAQKALLDSGLFSSVEIYPDTTNCEDGTLPIIIELTESKYRSISVGASYQTQWGAGGNLAWENRNVGGVGSKLHFEADVTQKSITGIASYAIPDFKVLGQDLVWLAEAQRENVSPSYYSRSYSFIGRLDKKVSPHFSTSFGIGGERLFVTQSVDNGNYWLAIFPLYLRYNTTDSLLNPSKGFKTHYHAKPNLSINHDGMPFIYQEARLSTYLPLLQEKIIIAHLFTLSSILSYKLSDVPVSKRIFGGSEENLRGYKFQTVSPLNSDQKPIGGRGGFFYSFEMRFRLNKSFGVVPFFDAGRVSRVPYPTVFGKWYMSTGLGFRYYSFFGPFRIDVGFPLERRKGIDNRFRFLASIGQSF